MTDACKQVRDLKYKDARRLTRPSGPPTAEERAWQEKIIQITLDCISASADKFIEYGVDKETAFQIVFDAVSDRTLVRMIRLISGSEMKKSGNE